MLVRGVSGSPIRVDQQRPAETAVLLSRSILFPIWFNSLALMSAWTGCLRMTTTVIPNSTTQLGWWSWTERPTSRPSKSGILRTRIKASYVFTRSADIQGVTRVKFVSRDIVPLSKDLKRAPGKDIWLVGGLRIITEFIKASCGSR